MSHNASVYRVIARPRMKGRGTLLRHIFQPFWCQFSPPVGDNVDHFCHVSQWMRAYLRIIACHVDLPTATVFPEDVCRACTFRSLCASKKCAPRTLKHGSFEFERGRPNLKGGGRSAKVGCFGENPGISMYAVYIFMSHQALEVSLSQQA